MNEFRFSCGKCGQHLKAEADCVNLVIACPMCNTRIRIPEPGAAAGDELPVAFVTTETPPPPPSTPAPAAPPPPAATPPSAVRPAPPAAEPTAAPAASPQRLSPALLYGGVAVVLVAAGLAVWFWKPWLGGATSLPSANPLPQPAGQQEAAAAPEPAAPGTAVGSPAPAPEAADPTALSGLANRFLTALKQADVNAAKPLVSEHADEAELSRLFDFIATSNVSADQMRFEMGAPEVNQDRAVVPVTVQTPAGPAALNLDLGKEPAGWRVAGLRLQPPAGAPGAPAPPELRFAFAPAPPPAAATGEAPPPRQTGGARPTPPGRPRGLLLNALGFAFRQGVQALNRSGSKPPPKSRPGPPAGPEPASPSGAPERPGPESAPPAPSTPAGDWEVDFAAQPSDARAVVEGQLKPLGLSVSPSLYTATSDQQVKLPARQGTRLELIEEVGRQIGWKPVYADGQLKFERGRRKAPVAFAGPFLLEVSKVSPSSAFGTAELTVSVTGVGVPEPMRRRLEQAGPGLTDLAAITPEGTDLFDAGAEVEVVPKTERGGPVRFEQKVALRGVYRGVDRIANFRATLELPGGGPAPARFVFTLKDLPLKPGPDAPAEARPLVFEGDSPATAKVVSTIPGHPFYLARIEVVNRADRPLRRLVLQLSYLNAAGEAIGATTHTQVGRRTLPGPRERWILSRVPLRGRPEKTARVRVEVVGAEFFDGTRWEKPGPPNAG